ncbi:hypothetical protein HJG60_011199 [Phyllostomus discolor]|uniref:Uncharacterized protein n=1 Tax=Phyllostomus discolor TaxID=89673 RepID=A0A834E583_9CHIR|nr:hypothetical protein HJG60_011199 [Phyllostomus discolor]
MSKIARALARWLSLLERHPVQQKTASSIPDRGGMGRGANRRQMLRVSHFCVPPAPPATHHRHHVCPQVWVKKKQTFNILPDRAPPTLSHVNPSGENSAVVSSCPRSCCPPHRCATAFNPPAQLQSP